MATTSTPPVVQWMKESDDGLSMQIATLWDAGIVQAGDDSDPQIFYIWNNFQGTAAVADMINSKLSVRDKTGGYTDGDIAKQERAIVLAQMYDQSRQSGAGQWGSFNAAGNWTPDTNIDLMWNNARDIIAASGATKGTISGAANSGRWKDDAVDTSKVADNDNFCKVKLVLRAKSDADAGKVEFRVRCSYQYV